MSAITSPEDLLSNEPALREPDAWWSSLRHFGLLLSPAEVARVTRDQEIEPLSWWASGKLRRQQTRFEAGDLHRNEFVAWVLEEVCELRGIPTGRWQRGNAVGAGYTKTLMDGSARRPTHVWKGEHGGALPVFVDSTASTLGVGRGRKALGDTVQWLRLAGLPFALLTNAKQWRLVYAGLDFEASCEWDSDLWFEDGRPGPQLEALRRLLQPALLDGVPTAVEIAPSTGEASIVADSGAVPTWSREPVLLAAVRASRRGQSELSAMLGERVREAVEHLVRAHGSVLDAKALDASGADIYRAAVRVVMRMVFVLFAESRGLLPRDNPVYEASYGLQGLVLQLEKVAHRGRGRLAHSYSAWPRVLALFRLVHEGSWHEAMQLPAYGGELFAPGAADDADPVSRALHLFESACFESDEDLVPDSVVYDLLDRLTRTKVRIRQGRAFKRTTAPVDFSDLSSEYIGILYEGLLDYELRPAGKGDPVIFLGIGDEPALPLSRLQEMDDKQIANLFEKLKETKGDDESEEAEGDEAAAEDAEPSTDEEGEDAEGDDEDADVEAEDELSAEDTARNQASAWARRACLAAKLVRKLPPGASPDKVARYERELDEKVRSLVRRVVLPGQWYLVRWGGTRKGSGTFYTRPGLAVPTVHRTLRPLAYEAPMGTDGLPTIDAAPSLWKARRPEEILALKVCDPGCGSGSFLVGSLRFLTDAVYAGLFEHGRLDEDWRRPLDELLGLRAPGTAAELESERLPCPPTADDFEPRTKAVLRRYVVERCLYGVDLDPLAIELCRLAMWIETMDRDLPFTFLDHKVKCGNSLVGAWFDQFQHYPVMAWKNREGGDKSHTNGVHFEKDARTKAIKAFVADRLVPDVKRFFAGRTLFSPDLQEQAVGTHEHALEVVGRLHDLPVQDSAERSRVYREELLESLTWRALRSAMDLWCACWFWPADALADAPLPTTLASPPEGTRRVASQVAAAKRFFHWELEFPDVFRAAGSGFDAIVGNPPWDIAKPNSKEFFSNLDPLYRSYGKQEALEYQKAYFADLATERAWLDYNGDFRAQSNFMGYAAFAFGDPKDSEKSQDRFSAARGKGGLDFHERWRPARQKTRGYSDPAHAFRHQGSADLNLYKLFLEQVHALLKDGGRLGMIVPSGIYSDHGTGALRELFLEGCRWEWLFGFENREKVFDIDSRFKFNPLIVVKGGRTEAIRTAFMRRRLEDWEKAEEFSTPYSHAQVTRFSPRSRAILEIQSARDLEILEKIYSNSVLLGDDGPDGWGIKYATEFHMTNDSKLFPPRPKWEAEGYRPDEYSRWLKGDWRPIASLWSEMGVDPSHVVPIDPACLAEIEARGEEVGRTAWRVRCAQPPYDLLPIPRADIPEGVVLSREGDAWIHEDRVEDVALPLYEGRMIGQFDFSQKGWVSGKGRSAKWPEIPFEGKFVLPQFCMSRTDYLADTDKDGQPKALRGYKLAFMDVGSATNERTMVASVVRDMPCGNSVPVLGTTVTPWTLAAILNSLAYDFVTRRRCSGLHLNYFVIEDSPLPPIAAVPGCLETLVLRLFGVAPCFADAWLARSGGGSTGAPPAVPMRASWGISAHERCRLWVMAEVVAAASFGLTLADWRQVLAGCDTPVGGFGDADLAPNGFWRVDKDKEPELRHTVLSFVAFQNLQDHIDACGGDRDAGIRMFVESNSGEGWMLPETLCLAEYGLGKDERGQRRQPVASRLGPRFLDWQLGQTPAEFWSESRLHARNVAVEKSADNADSVRPSPNRDEERSMPASRSSADGRDSRQRDLFE